MADQPLLGPDGRPLPNPFFSGQQQSKLDISVNIKPAVQAFSDLQNILDNLSKNFGVHFQKATAENLKAQENFYKYIGDRENERRTAVERLKRAAIDSVNEELKAQLSAYEEEGRKAKLTQEQINKGKIDLAVKSNQQIANIEREAAKKASPGFIGRTLESAQNIGNRIGGPIGGTISGIANLVAEPEIALPAAVIGAILEIMGSKAAFAKTGTALKQAGLGGIGGGPGAANVVGLGANQGLFADFQTALAGDEKRAILGMAAQSSFLTRQLGTSTGIGAVNSNLKLFANVIPDASKEMEIFADASKSVGTSQRDLSKIFFQSSKSAKDLGITQMDAISTQLAMQKALRNITNDGTVAAVVLDKVGTFFKDIGKSEAERQRFTVGVATAGANLSLSQMVGMLAFTRGIGVTSPAMHEALFGKGGIMGAKGGGPFALMGEFFTKVGGFSKSPMQQIFAADALNRQFGLGLQTQDLPKFFDLAKTLKATGDTRQFAQDVEALSKQSKALTIDGMETLVGIVSPIQRIEHAIDQFWINANELFTKYFGAPKYGGPAVTSQSITAQQNITKGKTSATNYDVHVSH